MKDRVVFELKESLSSSRKDHIPEKPVNLYHSLYSAFQSSLLDDLSINRNEYGSESKFFVFVLDTLTWGVWYFFLIKEILNQINFKKKKNKDYMNFDDFVAEKAGGDKRKLMFDCTLWIKQFAMDGITL